MNAVGPLSIFVKSSIRNLGVTFDFPLTLDVQISGSVFLLSLITATLSPVVSHTELEVVIHAFVSSCLDYCNSLFICLNKNSLEQNSAARHKLKISVFYCHISGCLIHMLLQFVVTVVALASLLLALAAV